MWSFSSWGENFLPRAEFPGMFSVTVSEAAVGRCSMKKVLLKIWQNSHENASDKVSRLV